MTTTFRRSTRAGFTAVEIVFAASMLAMILGVATMAMTQGTKTARYTELANDVHSRARRALDRVAAELLNAGVGQLVPDPGVLGTSAFNFRRNTGIDVAGNPTWSETWRFELLPDVADPSDNLDNDGDGAVDERTLWMTRDVGGAAQTVVVLCNDVSELAAGELPNGADDNGDGLIDELGFVVTRGNDLLTLSLTLEGHATDGTSVESGVTTNVRLRN